MKNLCLSLSLVFCLCCSSVSAQSPVVAEGGWIPMVTNTTAFVPYNYSVTNYYTGWRRVDFPLVEYYQIRQEPTYAPSVYFVQPRGSCFWWNNRPYYMVYPNSVYQYVPARY